MSIRLSRPITTPRARWSSFARLLAILLRQARALAVLVGVPALFTAIAPVSWVAFERHDGRVAARVRNCLLFVVPYRTQTIEPVAAIGERVVAGTSTDTEERLTGDPTTTAEDTGCVEIRGPEGAIEVCVSQASVRSVVDRAAAFLDDPQAAKLRMVVVANWKASVLCGGCVSLLAAISLVLVIWVLAARAIDAFRSTRGGPPA